MRRFTLQNLFFSPFGWDKKILHMQLTVNKLLKELKKDHNAILELAQAQGFVTVDEVEARFNWTYGRAFDALDTLLEEGLAMIDDGHRYGKRWYWFPFVSTISSSVVTDS